jgi:hypothetical protein
VGRLSLRYIVLYCTEEETVHLSTSNDIGVWRLAEVKKTKQKNLDEISHPISRGRTFGCQIFGCPFYFEHSTESLKGTGSRLLFVTPKKNNSTKAG